MSFEELPDGPTFIAAFDSDCGHCEFPLREGQLATFDGHDAVHVKCPKPRPVCPDCWLVHGTHQEDCE